MLKVGEHRRQTEHGENRSHADHPDLARSQPELLRACVPAVGPVLAAMGLRPRVPLSEAPDLFCPRRRTSNVLPSGAHPHTSWGVHNLILGLAITTIKRKRRIQVLLERGRQWRLSRKNWTLFREGKCGNATPFSSGVQARCQFRCQLSAERQRAIPNQVTCSDCK